MGIENRDYVRGSSSGHGGYVSYGGGYGYGMTPACKWILITTITVFVLQLIWTARPSEYQIQRYKEQIIARLEMYNETVPRSEQLSRQEIERQAEAQAENYRESRHAVNSVVQRWLELDADRIFPGFQLWRLATYAFCHSDDSVWHIVMNMLALWFFGPTLERMYGTREFTWFYFLAAAAAGLVFLGLELLMGGLILPMIGASGAVMAVLMLYAVHYPRQVVRIWGIIPIEVRWIVGLFIIIDVFPVLRSLGGRIDQMDNVAHSAHLGGLLFGYLYFKFQWRFERMFSGLRLPERSSRGPRDRGDLRLYEPPDNLDEQVDAILEKISETGESSLTDREREILKAASNRYKKRT